VIGGRLLELDAQTRKEQLKSEGHLKMVIIARFATARVNIFAFAGEDGLRIAARGLFVRKKFSLPIAIYTLAIYLKRNWPSEESID
jgi:hypothetical protein